MDNNNSVNDIKESANLNESVEVQEEDFDTKNLSFSEKINIFFTKPSLLFKPKIEKPSYAKNFWILCAITVIYNLINTMVTKTKTDELMNEMVKGMDAQTAELTKGITGFFSNPIVGSILTIIGFVILVYFASLIYFLLAKLFKGEGKYSHMVSTYLLASYPIAVGQIVKIIYMLVTKNPIGFEAQANPTLTSTLMSKFEIFVLWKLVLLVIGISTVFKMSKKKSATIIIIVFLIVLGYSLFTFSAATSIAGMQ